MSTPMTNMVYSRSEYFESVLNGGLKFHKGTGVTSIMTNATHADYGILLKGISGPEPTEKPFDTIAMYEILENKWFIHAYDLIDMLN